MHTCTNILSTQALTDTHVCKDTFIFHISFVVLWCFLQVVFEAHAEGHHHYTLALLLSPFSYTTTAVVVKAHE